MLEDCRCAYSLGYLMELIAKALRKGEQAEISGIEVIPINHKKVKLVNGELTDPDELNTGHQVFCLLKGSYIVDQVTDWKQFNYLPRFKIRNKWIGKTKILGKLKSPHNNLSKVTIQGNISYMIADEVAEKLETELVGKHFCIITEPEVLDFTSEKLQKLVVIGKGARFDLSIPKEDHELAMMVARLCIYNPNQKSRTIVGWNLKSFYSYILGRLGHPLKLVGNTVDLKLAEAFRGIRQQAPKTFYEAEKRIAASLNSDSWKSFSKINNHVYKPLMTEVIPTMETMGMATDKEILHASYEIEGQVNGRLLCASHFRRSFNPHNMSEKIKGTLRSTNPDYDRFMYWDFKSMEVYVLQWLAQCPQLGKIIDSGRDVYSGIWEQITKSNCNDKYRDICKKLFLPIVFGASSKGLSERTGIAEQHVKEFISRVYINFPVAMQWVQDQQDSIDSEKKVKDYYGRIRVFEDAFHRIRNFAIQSPAAIVCLHKLVLLHQALNESLAEIVYHVHDGYVLRTCDGYRHQTYEIVKEVLEAEDDLYPGLRLKVGCVSGKILGGMTPISN